MVALPHDKIFMALHRIGPYHHARINTASSHLDLVVLETRPMSQEYPWAFTPTPNYLVYRLEGAKNPEDDPPLWCLDQQLVALLEQIRPKVIVSVGWADRAYQRLLLAAHRLRIPLVIVSDSREHDEPRSALKEWLKSQLLCGYAAALVAGRESRAYLEQLGFPAALIHQPWDVVDNNFFSSVAEACRDVSPLGRHFLCVSRFVAKKNHAGLLRAYGAYQREGGAWPLRLMGSGPLEGEIRAAISRLPDPSQVRLDPFLQLEDLAIAYGQASSFVLASSTDQWGLVVNEAMAAGLPCIVSSACGCAVDLIKHGVTGWSFAPNDPAALTALLHTAEQQSPIEHQGMVAAARERLNLFTPTEFAVGLQEAVKWACAQPRHSRRSAMIASFLSRRS